MQADLRDTAGSVPGHRSKADITIKPVTHITFWFPTAYKNYVYTILYCTTGYAITLNVKSQYRTLI